MDTWIDRLARTLDEEPLSQQETDALLEVARDVAHRVERKVTPLSTFLLGLAVGRAIAGGSSRAAAFDPALANLRASLPDEG
jgi:hypothetical protein